MEKSERKIKRPMTLSPVLGLIMVFLLVLLFVIGYFFYDLYGKDRFIENFKYSWGINLPSDSELLYNESEHSFTGDGYRYYVVQLNTGASETEAFLRMFATYRDADTEELYIQAVDKLAVPNEYRLTLGYGHQTFYRENEEQMWKLLMLYDVATGRLYIAGDRI